MKRARGAEQSEMELEDQVTDMDQEVHGIIKQRLTDACGRTSKAFRAVIKTYGEHSFFSVAGRMDAADEREWIASSKIIAHQLAGAQTVSANGGYLLIIQAATEAGLPATIVIKAELTRAFRKARNEETLRSRVEVVRDLFLVPSNKFFKIGIVYRSAPPQEDDATAIVGWDALVFDDQFGNRKTPADYFVEKFLGFSLEENAKIVNKQFYEETLSSIQKSQAPAQEKREALSALKVELRNNNQQIDPNEFGNTHLHGTILDSYRDRVVAMPQFQQPFVKDTTLVLSQVRKRVLFFDNGIKIQGPTDEFDNDVNIVATIDQAQEVLNDVDRTLISFRGVPNERG